jgi:hypothetical protein
VRVRVRARTAARRAAMPDDAGAPLLKISSSSGSSGGAVGVITAAASAGAPAAATTPAQRRAAVRIQRRVRAYLDGKKTQRRLCVPRACVPARRARCDWRCSRVRNPRQRGWPKEREGARACSGS